MLQRGESLGRVLDCVRDGRVVVLAPFAVDGGPFLFGQLVGLGGDAVVLAGAHEMLGVVAAGQVPVRA